MILDLKNKHQFLIEHGDSLFDDQLKQLCGDTFIATNINKQEITRIPQVILVEAKKNPKTADKLRSILLNGFEYNGKKYIRYGKSASQGKDGITLFVDESVYDSMFESSQLGISIDECVISKYEAQRSLTLSNCTLIDNELPYIVIVDEYTKVIPNQYIRYVVEEHEDIIDKTTNEHKSIKVRRIKEGYHDIKISPFDGCGCHDVNMSKLWSEQIGLDGYSAIGYQIRLPFFKGYSVEVPFKEYFKSIGIDRITDIFGNKHDIQDIDCIWNVSMWKGYGIFKNKFGNNGWIEYVNSLHKYNYKLGISKYSHHKKDLNLKSRLNFQYIQCLDLWNKTYVDWFTKRPLEPYDILDKKNWGNVLKLASYSTQLFENIIKGDKFYSMKFLGIEDTETSEANGNYLKAVHINQNMLKDPSIRQFIYRKAKKSIDQMKYGKIYADGYYHTVVGDMIGYLEYAAGKEVKGCLNAKEFYCKTIPLGKCLSFRSPLVCPSEVNDVNIVTNPIVEKWFSNFENQDVVMLNMYDLSMPQQGGMDADGDAVYLCYDKNLLNTKINKTMIIDIEDKATAKVKPYNQQSIIEYEMNSRDNRIGEITNVATSILNQYTKEDRWKIVNEDNISLLRIFQGKEIDFIKTGLRWHMNNSLRKHLKRLPYFLLYNYPEKLSLYQRTKKKNKDIDNINDRLPLNAYQSPSPLNELCDYILMWEKKKILWDKACLDTRCLIVSNDYDLSNQVIRKKIKHLINEFSEKWRDIVDENCTTESQKQKFKADRDNLFLEYKRKIFDIGLQEEILANYVIDVSYSNNSICKALAWNVFGDTILDNLKSNTPNSKHTKIIEVPYNEKNTYEYLGKYYKMIEGDTDL